MQLDLKVGMRLDLKVEMRLDLKGRGFQPRRESKFNQPRLQPLRVGRRPTQLRLPHPARFSQGGHDAAEANGLTLDVTPGRTSFPFKSPGAISADTQPSKITKAGAAGFSLR